MAAGPKPLSEQFAALCTRIGYPGAPLFAPLAAAYQQPERHYHNLQHIADCLDQLAQVRHLARQADALELAIWYHDVVYDTHASDNEAQSAACAARALASAGAASALTDLVHDLILSTRHTGESQTGDQALLVDIDLAILGSPSERFDRYESAIRQEYRWVPEPLFRAKRAEILRAFLARPSLFHTPCLRDRLEERARANLARSLVRLRL